MVFSYVTFSFAYISLLLELLWVHWQKSLDSEVMLKRSYSIGLCTRSGLNSLSETLKVHYTCQV